jgi:uncharacterized membrane protein
MGWPVALPYRDPQGIKILIGVYKTQNIMVDGTGKKTDGESRKPRRVFRVAAVLVLVCAVVLAFVALSAPEQSEPFTEFYLLGQDGAADSLPRECILHEPQELIIGVYNHEYENEAYILEIFLVEEQFDPIENATSIASMDLIERYAVNLSQDEGRELVYRFGIDSPQYNKIELLLHRDEVPAEDIRNEDRINASYRDLHLWIDVQS